MNKKQVEVPSIKSYANKADKDPYRAILIKYLYAFTTFIILFFLMMWFFSKGRGIYSSGIKNLMFFAIILFTFTSMIILAFLLLKDSDYQHPKKKFDLLDMVHFLMMVVGIIMFFQAFVLNITTVEGDSMESALHENDRVIVNLLHRNFKNNNIVVMRAKDYVVGADEDYYVKRILGVPGDKISYRIDEENSVKKIIVFINSEQKFTSSTSIKDENDNIVFLWQFLIDEYGGTVPKDKYVLVGDFIRSQDSKQFGYVNKKDILGVVWFRLYKEFGVLK